MSIINNKTILVTGSGGLLGGELVKQLLEDGNFYVIAMTSQVETLKGKFSNENLKIISNTTWKEDIHKDNSKVDTLINCAFPRSSKPEQLALGIPLTEKVIKDGISMGVKNIINISSQSVYSQKQKDAVTEHSRVQPESLYGMTKYACERIVALLCEKYNINYSNIRLGSLTGKNFDVRMTNRFVKSVVAREKIKITGGKQKLSYLDVRDAARGLISMLNVNPNNWNTTYNLGNEEQFTLIDLVDTIKVNAKNYGIDKVDVQVEDGDSNFNNVMNNNLFYEQFSFKPKYTLKIMLNEQFNRNLL